MRSYGRTGWPPEVIATQEWYAKPAQSTHVEATQMILSGWTDILSSKSWSNLCTCKSSINYGHWKDDNAKAGPKVLISVRVCMPYWWLKRLSHWNSQLRSEPRPWYPSRSTHLPVDCTSSQPSANLRSWFHNCAFAVSSALENGKKIQSSSVCNNWCHSVSSALKFGKKI